MTAARDLSQSQQEHPRCRCRTSIWREAPVVSFAPERCPLPYPSIHSPRSIEQLALFDFVFLPFFRLVPLEYRRGILPRFTGHFLSVEPNVAPILFFGAPPVRLQFAVRSCQSGYRSVSCSQCTRAASSHHSRSRRITSRCGPASIKDLIADSVVHPQCESGTSCQCHEAPTWRDYPENS